MERCDVVVIGGGSAAFDAAVAACENGANRVVMLEKAPESEYGGNARYSGTGFRFWHGGPEEIREFVADVDDDYFKSLQISPYGKEEFSADLERMTLGRMDPQLARTLVEESNGAIHWMKNTGIRWELLKEHAKVGNKRYFERGIAIHVAGGGVGQLEQWRRIAGEKCRDSLFVCGECDPWQHASRRRRARLHATERLRSSRPFRHCLRRWLPGKRRNARAIPRSQCRFRQ